MWTAAPVKAAAPISAKCPSHSGGRSEQCRVRGRGESCPPPLLRHARRRVPVLRRPKPTRRNEVVPLRSNSHANGQSASLLLRNVLVPDVGVLRLEPTHQRLAAQIVEN